MKKHAVTYNGHEVHNLNELEFVNGEVWANVWQVRLGRKMYIFFEVRSLNA